jgi:hypothetical protein
MEPNKREYRQLKRHLKQKGGKRRRAFLKRQLDGVPTTEPEGPDAEPDAADGGLPDEAFDFGRARSADYNGLDRASDSKRRRREDDPR